VGVNSGLRQALVLVLCWVVPVALRFVLAAPGKEIWIICVIPAALCALNWGIRGGVFATLITTLVIGAVSVFKGPEELWAAASVGTVSLVVGVLFAHVRHREVNSAIILIIYSGWLRPTRSPGFLTGATFSTA
jgi:glucose-6-phosphate-specific signal transduction histidine kinase